MWEILSEYPLLLLTGPRTARARFCRIRPPYRERRIPVIKAIGEILKQAVAQIQGEYLFTMQNGLTFTAERFPVPAPGLDTRALIQAEVTYRKPYTTRHTFAAYQDRPEQAGESDGACVETDGLRSIRQVR